MRFGDKLIFLRKKNGLSQEDLASKLNVSRQAVSKWESNNTYPETDKIIQICNIFDCRMDDLINDKIMDIEQCERKNRNNISFVIDSLLEFITKSINMFTSMKFSSILRCIIEFGILIFCLFLVGMLAGEIVSDLIMNLLRFLPDKIYYVIYNVVWSILKILLIGLGSIIVIHVFKIRYLDFYDKICEKKIEDDENSNKEANEVKLDEDNEKKIIKKEKRMKFKLHQEPKIIIRDKHTTFAFLTGISKVIIGVFKAFVAMVACCFVVSLVFLVALFVISICLTKYSVLFIGIDISLVAISVINVLILLVMINYIINKKTNFVIILYVFLGSLVFLGCGLGIGCVGLSQFKFLNSMDGIEGKTILKKKEINVEDNLIIRTDDIDGYSIKIDNSMSDRTIKVVGSNDENYFIDVNVWHEKEYGMSIYYIHNSTSLRFNTIIEMIYNDLENKIFRNYYISDGDLEVVCNSKVAEMLINNAKKTYLVDVLKTDNGYRIGQFNQKIYLDYSCEMEYDARSGKYSFDDRCLCTKEERMSPNGNLIDFDCKNISSDERI